MSGHNDQRERAANKMVELERAQNPWMSTEQTQSVGADFSAAQPPSSSDWQLGVAERAFSAAGAAFLSAIIVNPLDVVKTRLQAQAAGVPYSHPLSNVISRMSYFGPSMV